MTNYLLTFLLAVASVGLWTLRVALTARGLRVVGSVVATAEAVVFVMAFSHVLGSLETPAHVVIYGLGVGVGTFTGLSFDRLINIDEQPQAIKNRQKENGHEKQTAEKQATTSAG